MSLSKELLEEQFATGNWTLHKTYPELETHIGQNSIDVTFSPHIVIPDGDFYIYSTLGDEPEQGYYLAPHQFILGAVNERIDCSNPIIIDGVERYFYPCIETRSTVARNGLCVHISAGLGDYGFVGFFTLELFNYSSKPILLQPKKRIAQITFRELITGGIEPISKYDSEYNTFENKPVLPRCFMS